MILCLHAFTVLPAVLAIGPPLRLVLLHVAHSLCCPENYKCDSTLVVHA
jgi:hypothetical protein